MTESERESWTRPQRWDSNLTFRISSLQTRGPVKNGSLGLKVLNPPHRGLRIRAKGEVAIKDS